MRRSNMLPAITIGAAMLVFAGCTVHPAGESDERSLAKQEGSPYAQPFEQRTPATLPSSPSADDMVRVAILNNADLEQKYWDWRSAIEQIPQDGTESTNLSLSLSTMIDRGSTRLDQTTAGLGNDPMSDIVLPPKLSIAARRALDNAKAAGLRFEKAKFALRTKVLEAWADYALSAELARLEDANVELLRAMAATTESLNRSGTAGQQDVLKAHNEIDMAANAAAALRAQLVAQRASLSALLGRQSDAEIPTPAVMPTTRPITATDDDLLSLAARHNPELLALAEEVHARNEAIALARLQYIPDFSLTGDTDLKGLTQTLAGSITVPFFRHEAIDAAVAQAQANLHSTQAMRRQTASDLRAQVVMDVVTLHDADRQLALLQTSILPRARQVVVISRSAYESGHSSLLELLDSQRSLIDIERLIATLQTTREKSLADLEAVTMCQLSPPPH